MMQPSPLRISERLDWDSIDLGHGGSIGQPRKNRLGELLREQKNVPLREMSLVWPAYQSSLKYVYFGALERNDDASRR